jgi:hypothetical protein
MADNVEFSAFTKRELGKLAKTFQAMGDDAVEESKKVAYDITILAKDAIRDAGYARTKAAPAVRRVVDGSSVSRTSKTGRLSYGFASQRFSGGATTQILWRGLEFGSRRFKQFPVWSGRYSASTRGSKGYFIFPTLREIQPQLTLKYLQAMNKVVQNWSKSG